MPGSQVATAARDDQPQEGAAAALAPPRWRTLTRAAPSLVLIVAVCLAPLWGVLQPDWSVLAVVFAYVADGAARRADHRRRPRSRARVRAYLLHGRHSHGPRRLHGLQRPPVQARRRGAGPPPRGLRELAVLGRGRRLLRRARLRLLVGLRARRRGRLPAACGGGRRAAAAVVRAAVRRGHPRVRDLLAAGLIE